MTYMQAVSRRIETDIKSDLLFAEQIAYYRFICRRLLDKVFLFQYVINIVISVDVVRNEIFYRID